MYISAKYFSLFALPVALISTLQSSTIKNSSCNIYSFANNSSFASQKDFLVYRGESFFSEGNYFNAIKDLEHVKEDLMQSFDEDSINLRIRCLHTLFLCHAKLNNYQEMRRAAEETYDLFCIRLEDSQFRHVARNSTRDFKILSCSDRPDPPDFDRGGCEYEREAQEYFSKAADKVVEAIGHSIAAGLVIECLPAAAIEVYQATKAWKEAAIEYNKGNEIQRGKK